VRREIALADELAEEFLLVHAVFKGLASIDEDDWDFVVELPAEFMVGIDVDFTPGESAAPRELREALFYDLAKMAAFAGVHDDVAKLWHAGSILTLKNAELPEVKCMYAGRTKVKGPEIGPVKSLYARS
jgi:hypothetical protein